MFAKLLKQEFRATRTVLLTLTAVLLCVCLLGGISMRVLLTLTDAEDASAPSASMDVGPDADIMVVSNQGAMPAVIYIACILLLIAAVTALIAYAVAAAIVLLHRFYTSRFSDEGYLTFTLPVSTHQLLLSTVVSVALWLLAAAAAVCLSAVLLITVGCSGMDGFWDAVRTLPARLGDLLRELTGALSISDTASILLTAANAVVSFFGEILLEISCITVGAVAVRKHRLLAGAGIYLGVKYLLSLLSVSSVAVLQKVDLLMLSNNLMSLALNLVLIFGGYFLTHYLMRSKLDLQ